MRLAHLMRKSFTLIELLIVIVIIWVLATALIPRLKGMQDRARAARMMADMKLIEQALIMTMHDEWRSTFWTEAEIGLWWNPTFQSIYNKTSGAMSTFSDHITIMPVNAFNSSEAYRYDNDNDPTSSACGWAPGINILTPWFGNDQERITIIDMYFDWTWSSSCGKFRYVPGVVAWDGWYHIVDDWNKWY